VSIQQAQVKNGWQARLELRYTVAGERTLLSHRHAGPLRVQRPFFPEGPVNHTYLLHPPGGLVGNDILQTSAQVERNAQVLITTPGATKAYRNICDASVIEQRFDVGGVLEWLPQEVILFDGSRLNSKTVFNLTSDAKLLAWEIQCLGRPVGEFPYVSGNANFGTVISIDGKPLLDDRLVLTGGAPIMSSPWGLNNATALGAMHAYPADTALRDVARTALAGAQSNATATLLDDLLVIRALGRQGQDIRRIFLKAWQALRPVLLNRMPCPPRIWAT